MKFVATRSDLRPIVLTGVCALVLFLVPVLSSLRMPEEVVAIVGLFALVLAIVAAVTLSLAFSWRVKVGTAMAVTVAWLVAGLVEIGVSGRSPPSRLVLLAIPVVTMGNAIAVLGGSWLAGSLANRGSNPREDEDD